MKVSWHGNWKHISARWHTKGLPVLHVAFLRERIQRGFKCYRDLTHKISQLWLTRVPNFHFFLWDRAYHVFFLLFLHRSIIWSVESTFWLHTFEYIPSARALRRSVADHPREPRFKTFPQKTPINLLFHVHVTLSLNLLAVPGSVVITSHLFIDAGEVLIGKQREPHISFFPFDLR